MVFGRKRPIERRKAAVDAEIVCLLASKDHSRAAVALETASQSFDRVVVAPVQENGEGSEADAFNEALESVASLEPAWIVCLRDGERIDADDGAALRELLTRDALPGIGYAFQAFPMMGETIDARFSWAHRAFAWEPNLHIAATTDQDILPSSIPRHRRLSTTIRMRHAQPFTEEAREPLLPGTRVKQGVGLRLKWPVTGWVTSPFGGRRHPLTGEFSPHHGIDVAAGAGSKVCAPMFGRVLWVGEHPHYGLVAVIDHGNSIVTVLAHLRATGVEAGAAVGVSTPIGTVGRSGSATGNHLHFEVRVAGIPVDPAEWLW